MGFIQKILLRVYGRLNACGFVSNPLGQRVFVQTYFFYKKFVEDPFHKLAKTHPRLFKDGHILDIGASIGYTSILFAGYLNEGYRVFAFEPESNNFAILSRNISRKRLAHKIVPERIAVGEANGTIDLWVNREHNGDHRIVTAEFKNLLPANPVLERLPMASIDEFSCERELGPIAFVKIDVQGFELPVCLGMQKTLERCPRAAIAFEYDPAVQQEMGFEPFAVPRFFLERGYRLFRLGRNGGLAEIDLESLTRERTETVGAYSDVLALRSDYLKGAGII